MANHWKMSKEPVGEHAVAWQRGQGSASSALSLVKMPAVLWRCEHFASGPVWQPCSEDPPNVSVAIQSVGAPTSSQPSVTPGQVICCLPLSSPQNPVLFFSWTSCSYSSAPAP